MADQAPKTIEALKAFCANKGMPLEKMRFFIGEDYREARAFGIYRDEDGDYVVYKNKADGSRSVRYQGPDEAYAVKEIYEKLKSEVELRLNRQAAPAPVNKKARGIVLSILGGLAALLVAFGVVTMVNGSKRPKGYYQYQSETYYYDSHDWYMFNNTLYMWSLWSDTEDWTESPKDYYVSSKYSEAYNVDDFKNSEYYHESSHSDDWSSGYDYDSWDSGFTDWSSDW